MQVFNNLTGFNSNCLLKPIKLTQKLTPAIICKSFENAENITSLKSTMTIHYLNQVPVIFVSNEQLLVSAAVFHLADGENDASNLNVGNNLVKTFIITNFADFF